MLSRSVVYYLPLLFLLIFLTYEILLPQKNKSTLDYLLLLVLSIHLLMFVI